MKTQFKAVIFCLVLAAGLFLVGRLVFASTGGVSKLPQNFYALESETQRLIREIVHRGYTVYTSNLRLRAAKRRGAASKPLADEKPEISVDSNVEKEFAWVKEVKEKEAPRVEPMFQKLYAKEKLSEGDFLYRVAMADGKMTLKEAEGIGLANRILLRSSRKKIQVARSRLNEARRALFPTVQGVLEFNGGKAQGSSTNLGGRLYKGEAQKINMTQTVFDGGELLLTVKQAHANLRSAEEEYAKTKGEYLAELRAAYYGAVRAEYNDQYQRTAYREAEPVYRTVKASHGKGVVSEIDFLNAESQYYSLFFQMESARNEFLSAQLVLTQTLSLEDEKPLALDLKMSFIKIDPDLYEVMGLALRNNPEVRIKQNTLESAEFSVKIYNAKKLPKVDLRGSFGYLGEVFKDTTAIATDNHDLDTEKEWFLGVNVSVPLGHNTIAYDQVKHKYGPTILALTGSEDWKHRVTFDLFDKLSDLTEAQSAEATYWQALAELEAAKDGVIVKAKDELFNLRKSLIQVDSSIAKMRYQERQNDILKYLMGLEESSPAAYLESLTELAQSKFAFIQAVTDYHLAVSNVNLLMGNPDYFESKSERSPRQSAPETSV